MIPDLFFFWFYNDSQNRRCNLLANTNGCIGCAGAEDEQRNGERQYDPLTFLPIKGRDGQCQFALQVFHVISPVFYLPIPMDALGAPALRMNSAMVNAKMTRRPLLL